MRINTILILSFVFLFAACSAGEPEYVHLNYEPNNRQLKTTHAKGEKVTLRIANVKVPDKRFNQESLGSTDAPIYGKGGITEWVRHGILSLSELGYSHSHPQDKNKPSDLSLIVNIQRASCRGAIMYMRCTVLIEVKFLMNGTIIQQKTYYGTQMEEKGIISEGYRHFDQDAIQQGLNGALEQFLVKLEADLRKISK